MTVAPKRRGSRNEIVAFEPAGFYSRAGGFAYCARRGAGSRPGHSGHDAAGRIAAPAGQASDAFQKPESLSALSVQYSSDRRLEPQSRRLHAVGLHRQQVTAPKDQLKAPKSDFLSAEARSEFDAQTRGRGDVLRRQIPVRQAPIDVRQHHAGVEIDAP